MPVHAVFRRFPNFQIVEQPNEPYKGYLLHLHTFLKGAVSLRIYEERYQNYSM